MQGIKDNVHIAENSDIKSYQNTKSRTKSDGPVFLKPFKSFHTHRILKPYIRQDFESEPSKLSLLREINQRSSKNIIPKEPINYTYIQPNHVDQVNRLARDFFWNGIDGESKFYDTEKLISYLLDI